MFFDSIPIEFTQKCCVGDCRSNFDTKRNQVPVDPPSIVSTPKPFLRQKWDATPKHPDGRHIYYEYWLKATHKKHSSNCSFNLFQGKIAQGLTINLDVRLPDWHDYRGWYLRWKFKKNTIVYFVWICWKLTKEKQNCLSHQEIRIGQSWLYEQATPLPHCNSCVVRDSFIWRTLLE